jgi:hypothetical protein
MAAMAQPTPTITRDEWDHIKSYVHNRMTYPDASVERVLAETRDRHPPWVAPEVPTRNYRPPNAKLDLTILLLGRLYYRKTGRAPGVSHHPITGVPGGPFFRFVSDTLHVYAYRLAPKTPEGLASAINRVRRQADHA